MIKLTKLFKISLVVFLLVVGGTIQAQAAGSLEFTDSNKNVVSSYTIDTDSVYVLLSNINLCGYCGVGNQTATIITQQGSIYDEQGIVLINLFTSPAQFTNAPGNGVTLRLSTTQTPSTSDNILDVEAGQKLYVEWTHPDTSETFSDTITVNVSADDNASIVVSNSTVFSATTSFSPEDSIYIQVSDSDENKQGFNVETLTDVVLISASGGDRETISIKETGANEGIFDNNQTGMTVPTVTTIVTRGSYTQNNGMLEVAPTGEIITVTYTDPTAPDNGSSLTNSGTITTENVVEDFSVVATSSQIAGTAFSLTITARDSNGDTLTGYSGDLTLTTNYVSPTSGTSAISPVSVSASAFTEGVAVVNVTYADSGTITITATDSSNNTGTSSNILVLPANFLVEVLDVTTQIVNKPFNLRVTARNSSNITTPNYNREVNLSITNVTPSETLGIISPISISGSNFRSGISTVNITYNKWGSMRIKATDSGYSAATGTTSSAVNFRPNSFSITVTEPPASRDKFYLEELFDLTVEALDYNDQIITNYGGTVTFIDIEQVEVPSDYTFIATEGGKHTFRLLGVKEKSFTIEVYDKNHTSVKAESEKISLIYAQIKVLAASGPVGTLKTVVEIQDKKGKVITSDNSTAFIVYLTENIPDNTASSPATEQQLVVANGRATISVRDSQVEAVTVLPASNPYLEPIAADIIFGGAGTAPTGAIRPVYWRELRKDELPAKEKK